jgi:enoyl-CoA hydratase/carnithine racemase
VKAEKLLVTENEQFSSSLDNEILVIREKRDLSQFPLNLEDVFYLYDFMDHALSSKAYQALVMFARNEQNPHVAYDAFLANIFSGKQEGFYLDRFLNMVNRYILSLSGLNCMSVFAGQGTVSLFYLNTGLAYDYRIVAEDTVFENLDLDLGLVTKGSGYFLPRLLGIRKASEVLQWKSFSAEDALQLGLVDLIVPVSKLEEETLKFASGNKPLLYPTLLNIRKLLKCDIKELKRSLDLEDHLIKERFKSEALRQKFTANR